MDLDRANWALFITLAFLEIKAEDFETVDDALDFLSEIIINAATQFIPRSSGKFKRRPVPWWNAQCRVARKAMRATFTRYRRNPCDSYLISYKKLRARFSYQVKQAKRLSWVNYISTITWKTTLSEVWTKIRKITGKYIPSSPPVIKENGSLITDPKNVSEAFAKHSATVSSKQPNSPYYQQHLHEENKTLDFGATQAESYNVAFTMQEFQSALSSCSDSAPGADNITYSMSKHLPIERERNFCLVYLTELGKKAHFLLNGI